jgi:hypothetical protein
MRNNKDKIDERDVLFNSLEKTLPKKFDFLKFKRIFFVLSVENTKKVFDELKLAISNNDLVSFSNKNSFKSTEDALELFLFEKTDGFIYAYILFDPFEFFESKSILDKSDFQFKFSASEIEGAHIIYETP